MSVPEITRRPRIADVARQAGVSKATVSFAFNSPERLSTETVERIRDVADNLGYRPHPVARMLAQRRTMTLGVLTPQTLSVAFSNPFFATFSQGLASAVEPLDYRLLFVSPVQGSLARAASLAGVDGFVAIGLGEDHPEVEQIRTAGLPIVLVDSAAFSEHGSIEVEDEIGCRLAAEHLIGLGHREFVVLAVDPPDYGEDAALRRTIANSVTERRLAGYRTALLAAGIALGDDRVVSGPASFSGGVAAFDAALRECPDFTAVLAMSDAMAIGAMHAARERGISVPGNLSVVGFDDLAIAEYTRPPLTTVHQPIFEKGAQAVAMLLTALDDRSARPEHRRLETRLVVRGSTAPVPATTQEVLTGQS